MHQGTYVFLQEEGVSAADDGADADAVPYAMHRGSRRIGKGIEESLCADERGTWGVDDLLRGESTVVEALSNSNPLQVSRQGIFVGKAGHQDAHPHGRSSRSSYRFNSLFFIGQFYL